jgi:hypothetical protein
MRSPSAPVVRQELDIGNPPVVVDADVQVLVVGGGLETPRASDGRDG